MLPRSGHRHPRLAERVVSGGDVDVPAEYPPHVQGYTADLWTGSASDRS